MASRFLTPFSTGRSLAGLDPLLDIHREMNRLFDDVLRGSGGLAGGGSGSTAMVTPPRLDVHENDDELCVVADMPGVKPSDLDLRVEGDVLTISGQRQEEQRREQQNFHVMERSYGRFQRSLQLPFSPDPNQVQAKFDNGVLELHIPKQAAQQRSHRIEVRSSTPGAATSSQIGQQMGEQMGEQMARPTGQQAGQQPAGGASLQTAGQAGSGQGSEGDISNDAGDLTGDRGRAMGSDGASAPAGA